MSRPPQFPSRIKTRKGFAAGQTCVHSKSPFPRNSSSDEIHLAAARGSPQLLDFTQFEILHLQPEIINRFHQIDCIHNLKF